MAEDSPKSGEGNQAVPAEVPRQGAGSHDVFVSYASQDAAIATVVVGALESHGIHCWIAPRDVTPGALYADGIIRAINRAKVLVLVLSASSVASKHVGKEVERASSKGRPIVTLKVDAAPLTTALEYFLSESHWIEVGTGGLDTATGKLEEAVKRHLDSTAPGAPSASPDTPTSIRLRKVPPAKWAVASGVAFVSLVLAYFAVEKFRLPTHGAEEKPAGPAVTTPVPAPPAIPAKSVAVLPFVDMSEKHDQEYFSDGLSEELIDMLSKVPELRVPARTSSFFFKGRQTPLADIAKALAVTHVLEGSVRRAGHTVRITAQLIRADNGYHVWSETYDRQFNDILKIQDDIAGAVVEALKVRLLTRGLPVSGDGKHADAYNLLLQSRFFGRRGSDGDEQKALECVQQAVTLDPGYALAWARLSANYDTRDPRARTAAQRAVELDPLLPDAHVSLGLIYEFYDWTWKAADTEFKRALALDPNNEYSLRANGDLAMRLGRSQDAIASLRRAADRDPLSPGAYDGLGDAMRVAGRLPEAEAAYRRALVLSPQDYWAHTYLGIVLIEMGRLDAAIAEIQQSTSESFRLWGLTLVYFAMSRKADSDQALAELTAKYAQQWPSMVAVAYAFRNELDPAFDWFARAYRQRDPAVTWLKVGPLWRNVRSDPRYADWLRKLDLQE